jgi:hypothetical protein
VERREGNFPQRDRGPKGVLPDYGLRKWIGAGESLLGTFRAVVGRSVKQVLLVTSGNVGLTRPGDPKTTRQQAGRTEEGRRSCPTLRLER